MHTNTCNYIVKTFSGHISLKWVRRFSIARFVDYSFILNSGNFIYAYNSTELQLKKKKKKHS